MGVVSFARRPSAAALVGAALLLGIALVTVARAGLREPTSLVVGMQSEPKTLNPIAITAAEGHEIAGLLFLKLLDEQDDFMTFRPQLAKTWSASDDGLAITFVLRDDARWSDGVPVTADDVRFTWELHVDTLVAWPSASVKSKIRDVQVVDARTVVFHYRERYLYQLMDANEGVILPKHLLGRVPRGDIRTSAFGRMPVGNGPYTLAKWESGQYMELVANPHHYGSAPRVRRVLFKFVPDSVTLVAQLKAGEIDVLEAVPPGEVEDIRRNHRDYEIYAIPSRRMNYVVWNLKREPFRQRDVRTALAMAIDRAEIIRTLWAGYARECNSPIHPILWAYDASVRPVSFDPNRARDALRRLGWEDRDRDGVLERGSRPFEFELLVNNSQNRIDVATMVQAHLQRIGVKANVRVLEYGAFIERVLAMDYDAAFVEWKAITKVDLTSLFHTKALRPNGFNFVSYSNPAVDAGIDEALSAASVNDAKRVWSKVQRAIYEDQPYAFLAVPQEITAVRRRFCNIRPNAISFFVNLPEWRITPDCPR